ncbi:hypothetical protein [Natronorubrum aibiense]|uniref:Uncharacterized protein n=1 Tax=Natronorubrum aibiense TaxID=348826 RepID=A0A5P9P8Y7_9EURY|nr:hypothetical protein [Natronorubrum aibiense]QFU84350.1 hypothetical protein GCU68_17445 [Natronorubrum aibiense]
MASRRQLLVIPLGFFAVVLLVGAGMFTVFQIQPNTAGGSVSDAESYPVGPEKPTPLNSSNIVNYTTTYEERLFYNDLVASHNHSLHDDESVITNCTSLTVSNGSTDKYYVQLECRGGVTDSSQPTESEEFTYSVTYQITNDTTQQTEFQNYPFGTDRTFNSERN